MAHGVFSCLLICNLLALLGLFTGRASSLPRDCSILVNAVPESWQDSPWPDHLSESFCCPEDSFIISWTLQYRKSQFAQRAHLWQRPHEDDSGDDVELPVEMEEQRRSRLHDKHLIWSLSATCKSILDNSTTELPAVLALPLDESHCPDQNDTIVTHGFTVQFEPSESNYSGPFSGALWVSTIVPTEILTPDSDLEDAYNGYIVALWDGGIGARLANHSLFTLSCPAWQFIAGFRAIPACNGLRGLQALCGSSTKLYHPMPAVDHVGGATCQREVDFSFSSPSRHDEAGPPDNMQTFGDWNEASPYTPYASGYIPKQHACCTSGSFIEKLRVLYGTDLQGTRCYLDPASRQEDCSRSAPMTPVVPDGNNEVNIWSIQGQCSDGLTTSVLSAVTCMTAAAQVLDPAPLILEIPYRTGSIEDADMMTVVNVMISDSNSSGVLQNVSFNNMIFPGQPMPVQKDSDKHLQQRIVAMQATPWCHGLLDLTMIYADPDVLAALRTGHLSAVSRSRDSGDSKGLIVGAVIGGFVGVMTVATAAYVALRLYRNRTAFSHAHAENKKTALITMGSGP